MDFEEEERTAVFVPPQAILRAAMRPQGMEDAPVKPARPSNPFAPSQPALIAPPKPRAPQAPTTPKASPFADQELTTRVPSPFGFSEPVARAPSPFASPPAPARPAVPPPLRTDLTSDAIPRFGDLAQSLKARPALPTLSPPVAARAPPPRLMEPLFEDFPGGPNETAPERAPPSGPPPAATARPSQPAARPPPVEDGPFAPAAVAAPRSPSLAARPVTAAPVAAKPRKGPSVSAGEIRAAPAALWRRLLASGVDIAIVGGLMALYLALASAVTHKSASSELSGLDGLMSEAHKLHTLLMPALFVGALLALVYSGVFAVLWEGRTPGRFLLGLRLVDSHGAPLSPARAGVRAALSCLSFLVFLGGYWLALFDRQGQTLHDKLTHTFVVRLA